MDENLLRNRIRYRVLLVVGVAAALGQIATALFYARHQEQTVMAQREFGMRKLTESITQGLQSAMLAGSADIAIAFTNRLKQDPDILDFHIMRSDGMEAFRDNGTILEVNRRRGREVFLPRDQEIPLKAMDPRNVDFQKALTQKSPVSKYETDRHGTPVLTFIAPIMNIDVCHRCHGKEEPVTGLIRVSTTLVPVEKDILQARQQSLMALVVSLAATILLIGYLLGRTVVKPVETVTRAMMRISGGDLEHKVAVTSHDEIGRMAVNFNQMTDELKETYQNLRLEQDKLTTVIESASEGMVATNAAGQVVVTNEAASRLLGKSIPEIVEGGFLGLVDDPSRIRDGMENSRPFELDYKGRILQIRATTIKASCGSTTGSVAMIRDISKEKKLENELRHLSTTDALTGLFNRRFLDQALDSEFQRAMRSHGDISLIMLDVDHFKKFNDVHGHDQGDRVLQMVARTLRETARTFDFPCRYGGEEFVLILPGIGSVAAINLAERLRVAVAATEVDGLRVSISLGVAAYPALDVSSGTGLVEAADAALYKAKEDGRNRVVAAGTTA